MCVCVCARAYICTLIHIIDAHRVDARRHSEVVNGLVFVHDAVLRVDLGEVDFPFRQRLPAQSRRCTAPGSVSARTAARAHTPARTTGAGGCTASGAGRELEGARRGAATFPTLSFAFMTSFSDFLLSFCSCLEANLRLKSSSSRLSFLPPNPKNDIPARPQRMASVARTGRRPRGRRACAGSAVRASRAPAPHTLCAQRRYRVRAASAHNNRECLCAGTSPAPLVPPHRDLPGYAAAPGRRPVTAAAERGFPSAVLSDRPQQVTCERTAPAQQQEALLGVR